MKLRFVGPSFVTIAVLLGISTPMLVELQSKTESNPPHARRASEIYRGGLVTPPLPKPKFTLTDTSGAPFDFWQQTDGYVTLLFFGYTHCSSECPLHMANIASGLKTGQTDLFEWGVQLGPSTCGDIRRMRSRAACRVPGGAAHTELAP